MGHQEIEAEPYVHMEPVAAPVAYAAYPYATSAVQYVAAAAPAKAVAPVQYTYAAPTQVVAATSTKAATAPVAYAYAAPYAIAAYHTGCVNSVGSVVPCAQN